ncbi:MAG: hypothetical protein PPP58_00285, partial [Natronomonas sp.]
RARLYHSSTPIPLQSVLVSATQFATVPGGSFDAVDRTVLPSVGPLFSVDRSPSAVESADMTRV